MNEEWTWGDEQRPEHERRWLVSGIERNILESSPSISIRQGYLGVPAGTRVRIEGSGENRKAEMTVKTGRGVSRMEHTAEMKLKAAGLALEATPFLIRKRRYFAGEWQVNVYSDKLDGLLLVEREMDSPDRELALPLWMHDPVEVTDTVCDELLSKLAYDFEEPPGAEALRGMLTTRIPRIVLTGGPCSGKSSAIRQLTADFPGLFHVVPEVASIVIEEVGVTPPVEDRAALRRYNRAFGEIQRSFETVALHQAIRDRRAGILLDRGTMDNAAYVPGGVPEIERIYMSPAAAEYARYDAVIIISVPNAEVYRKHMADNPARYESYDDVLHLARHVIFAWGNHPNQVIIPDFPTWEEKYTAIRREVMKHVAFR